MRDHFVYQSIIFVSINSLTHQNQMSIIYVCLCMPTISWHNVILKALLCLMTNFPSKCISCKIFLAQIGLQLLCHQQLQNNTNTDQTYTVEVLMTLNVTNKTRNKKTRQTLLSQVKMTSTGQDTLDHWCVELWYVWREKQNMRQVMNTQMCQSR